MNRLVVFGLCTLGLLAAGCYSTPIMPPLGLYSSFEAPLATGYGDTKITRKSGEATVKSVLGLVSWGDASVVSAAKEGSITTVHHADYRFYSFFGIYSTFTTIVYGE